MKRLFTIFILALTIGICFSCKKKSKDPTPVIPKVKTKTDYLSQHDWILTAATSVDDIDYDGNGTSGKDIYAQMDACEKDNYIHYSSDHAATMHFGPNVTCSDNKTEPLPPLPASWIFNSDETVITFEGQLSPPPYTVLQLDDTTLKISYESADSKGHVFTRTDTFIKHNY